MARFDAMTATMVAAMKAKTATTESLRALHDSARRDEIAWPGSTPKQPKPLGNQNLALYQLNALARGPQATS